MNNECQVELSLDVHEKKLCLSINWEGLTQNIQESLDVSGEIKIETICYWLMLGLKQILEQESLPKTILFNIDEQIQLIKPAYEMCHRLSKEIQKNLDKIVTTKKKTDSYFTPEQNFAILNIENSKDIIHLYKTLKDKNIKTNYTNFQTGWDSFKRVWGKNNFPSLENLLNLIQTHKSNTLVSINVYLLHHIYITERILALPLLKHLGVEFISLDYDVYDLLPNGSFQKALYTHPRCRRFSVYPSLSELVDKPLNLRSVRYYNYLDISDSRTEDMTLAKTTPTIFIAANSRLETVKAHLFPTLLFLSYTNSENPFSDYQWLYFALMHSLFEKENISFLLKIKIHSLFSNLYLAAMTLLKYEVIAGIDPQFKVEIFGDEGWKNLFPEHYQDKHLSENEIGTLLSEKKRVYLLFNQNFSALETNPVFQRALNLNSAYLTFPALAQTPDLEALSKLEYSNLSELNFKLKNINTILSDSSLKEALFQTKTKTHESYLNFIHQLKDKNFKKNTYQEYIEEWKTVFKKKLQQYRNENQERIEQCFHAILNPSSKNKNIKICLAAIFSKTQAAQRIFQNG